MRRGRRDGFTLFEILVATALGGVLMLIAFSLSTAILDGTDLLARRSLAHTAVANAERELRALIGSMDPAADASVHFIANDSSASFRSWCATALGGYRPCQVQLMVVRSSGAGSSLIATIDGTVAAHLRWDLPQAGLRFLADANAGGTWIREWNKSATLPIALAVVMATDTLILPIGDRG